jgi:glycine/D-amino acid oxidase-like deaminating enzyme
VSDFDVAVVGGGLVGSAVAYGLAREGRHVAVLDEGDVAYRASRGNFGLVWVQGKGLGLAAYGGWTVKSSELWARLAADIAAETGIEVAHRRPGGISVALSDRDLENRAAEMRRLHNQHGMTPYPYRVLDRPQVKELLPNIGPKVVGGIYCDIDGHANPLKLMFGLHRALTHRGAVYLSRHDVGSIAPQRDGFALHSAGGTVTARQVVLAAGLANARLAPMVALEAPVHPERGHIVVTERLKPFLDRPLGYIRQTDEGTVMIGDSFEDAGYDDRADFAVVAAIVDRALCVFPHLAEVGAVRSWAALRVITPDRFPIYDQSRRHPGAFVVTCHSGVTLTAVHALHLAPMIAQGRLEPEVEEFSARRFRVPAAA